MNKNTEFRNFCDFLRGWKIRNKRGEIVPKYILFWKGVTAKKLLRNETNYILIRRKNNTLWN